jgi:hypothetical protein
LLLRCQRTGYLMAKFYTALLKIVLGTYVVPGNILAAATPSAVARRFHRLQNTPVPAVAKQTRGRCQSSTVAETATARRRACHPGHQTRCRKRQCLLQLRRSPLQDAGTQAARRRIIWPNATSWQNTSGVKYVNKLFVINLDR